MSAVLPDASKVELKPDGPKATGYKEAEKKEEYMQTVIEDVMKKLDAREKGTPKGDQLASIEDKLKREFRTKGMDANFTSGYIDGVYAMLGSEGGRRRRRGTKKSRKAKRKTLRRRR